MVGNFSYAKLPMVLDMQSATDTIAESELICAIAGDEDARAAVRARHPSVAMNEPDLVPPQDEFLVLDADASQSYAINAAVGGADLVIDGPPGTGKSQTIANLIATSAARGQRTLFVAEKRAAIDAVLDRLNRVGLGGLVLDLHDGAGSKRKLAADLSRGLAAAGSVPRANMSATQESLVRRREVLVSRTSAIHERRFPWGVSVYEAQAGLLGVPTTARSGQRLRGEILRSLDGRTLQTVRAEVDAFVGLGGLRVDDSTPWASAFRSGTITTAAGAQAALEAVTTLATHTLPATADRFRRALDECALPMPETVGAWRLALTLLDDVAATLAVFDSAIFEQPLAGMASALTAGDKGALGRAGATLTDGDYRRARKAALSLWTAGKPKSAELRSAVAAAAVQLARWSEVASDRGRPRLPGDLAGTEGAYCQLVDEIDVLGSMLGSDDLGTMSLASLPRVDGGASG